MGSLTGRTWTAGSLSNWSRRRWRRLGLGVAQQRVSADRGFALLAPRPLSVSVRLQARPEKKQDPLVETELPRELRRKIKMSEISDDKMKLINDIKNSGGLSGDRKAESARAEFDALLAIDLATDLNRLSGEFEQTRKQMERSSIIASRQASTLNKATWALFFATLILAAISVVTLLHCSR